MSEKELLKSLERLDLTKNEARVYVELTKLGAVNAGPIIKNTGLHRQFVYAALDALVNKRLASYVVHNNRKVFQAAPGSALVALQEERERLAEAVVPQLAALEPQFQDRLAVHTLFGKSEFYRNLITLLEVAARHDKTMRIIGGATDEAFYQTLGHRYPEYVQACRQFDVRKLLIAPSNSSTKFKERFANEPGNALKLLQAGLSSPTYTRITPELVAIEVYAAEVMVIQIWNRAAARGYLEHFELLWAEATAFRP